MESNWFITLKKSPEEAWNLLTQAESLSKWFDPGAKLDPKKGGAFELPGGTQFRGEVGVVRVESIEPKKRIEFSWPVNDVPTKLVWIVEPDTKGSKLTVQCVSPDDRQFRPNRSNNGILKHYWKANLTGLQFLCELNRDPIRQVLKARDLKEVQLTHIYNCSRDHLWSAITSPQEMDKWISKRAEIDLRKRGRITYGWDHGATEILDLKDNELISYSWVNDDEVSSVSWQLTPVGSQQTRLDFRHHNFSGKYPTLATGYNEGWYSFMLLLGLYVEKGLVTKDWSNLNDDPNS
jgi:uncharacterized protein YndB with AHSA1/START domain